ncbi:hypothetical protein HPP92_026943, partial [Vanilla planifolia]
AKITNVNTKMLVTTHLALALSSTICFCSDSSLSTSAIQDLNSFLCRLTTFLNLTGTYSARSLSLIATSFAYKGDPSSKFKLPFLLSHHLAFTLQDGLCHSMKQKHFNEPSRGSSSTAHFERESSTRDHVSPADLCGSGHRKEVDRVSHFALKTINDRLQPGNSRLLELA